MTTRASRRIRRTLACALAGTVLLVAGCSSDDPPSSASGPATATAAGPVAFADWRAQTEAICAEVFTDEAGTEGTPVERTTELLDAVRSAEARITALGTPDERADDVDGMMSRVRETLPLYERAQEALKAGDDEAFQSYRPQVSALTDPANELAASLGVPGCTW